MDARALGVAVRSDRAEPLLIFRGSNERAHHAAKIIRLAIIEDVEPKVVAAHIHVAPQIAEVFHQHKRGIELAVFENLNVDYILDHLRARAALIHRLDLLLALSRERC